VLRNGKRLIALIERYRQARGFNRTAIPFLIGTKYDIFTTLKREEQEDITVQAKKFAKAMKASLVFTSSSSNVNIQKIFKVALSKAFDLKLNLPIIKEVGEPIFIVNPEDL
jgi:GTP-binding protein of the ras superfamily involved in termination of M-phase